MVSFPSSLALQKFSRLESSSQDFPEQLCDLLYGEDYTQCAQDLQEKDLVWFIEYLDQVWNRIALSHPLFKPA